MLEYHYQNGIQWLYEASINYTLLLNLDELTLLGIMNIYANERNYTKWAEEVAFEVVISGLNFLKKYHQQLQFAILFRFQFFRRIS